MTKMYVANATRQTHEFHYSLPEKEKRYSLKIPSFAQVQLPGDFSTEEVAAIVEQHQIYGFKNVDEINNSRTVRQFIGLCYSLGKVVTSSKIEALYLSNHSVLETRGENTRKEVAVASNDSLIRALKSEQHNEVRVDLNKVEMTIQQEMKDGSDGNSRDAISEGFRAENTPRQQTSAPTKKRR